MRTVRKKDIIIMVFVILIIFVTLSGNGFFSLRRRECIYILGAMAAYYGISIYRRRTEVKYILPLVYLTVSLWTTTSFNNTLAYLLIYLSGILLIYSQMIDDKVVDAIIKAFEWVGIANAVAIVLSPLVPNVVATIVGIIYYPPSPMGSISRTLSNINRGIYYGFCGEKSLAAFVMAIALIVYISEFFHFRKLSRGKWISSIILLIAIMMTGKRMEFLVPIICFLCFFLLTKRKGKGLKFIAVLLIGAIAIYLLPIFVPQAELVLERFQDSGADSFATGREVLWEYAMDMFRENRLFGTGYGSYNEIVNMRGFNSPTGEDLWGYHAHSIYFQLLGECGIIGCICWGITYLWTLIKGLRNIYKSSEVIPLNLLISVGMLMMILIYGLSGNTLYEISQLYLSFLTLAIYRKYEMDNRLIINGDEPYENKKSRNNNIS